MVADIHVSIRPYERNDVPQLFEAAYESVSTVSPWLPWCHPGYTIDESRTWVEHQLEAFRAGTEYAFVIVSPDNRFLGGCGLNAIDHLHLRANLGYWVRTQDTGRGVATTAVRLLVQWAFEHTKLNRLEIVAATANLASQRVAENAGATREGILRSRLMLHGTAHDAVIFSFIRKRTGSA